MRAACWTCRSRTIQCDQTSNPCAKCQKAGLECFEKRPLRWVKGVAIRGKMRGRVFGMDSKVSHGYPCPSPKRTQISHPSATSQAIIPTPKFALQDPCIHDLDYSSRFYLDYCMLVEHIYLSIGMLIRQKITCASPNCSFYMTVIATRLGVYSHVLRRIQLCERV